MDNINNIIDLCMECNDYIEQNIHKVQSENDSKYETVDIDELKKELINLTTDEREKKIKEILMWAEMVLVDTDRFHEIRKIISRIG